MTDRERLIELIDRSSLLEKAKKYEFWNGALYQWHCVDVKDIVNAPHRGRSESGVWKKR